MQRNPQRQQVSELRALASSLSPRTAAGPPPRRSRLPSASQLVGVEAAPASRGGGKRSEGEVSRKDRHPATSAPAQAFLKGPSQLRTQTHTPGSAAALVDACSLAPGIGIQLMFHVSKFHMKIPRSGLGLAQAGSEQPNLLIGLGGYGGRGSFWPPLPIYLSLSCSSLS